MKNKATLPTEKQIADLLDRLLPVNEDLDLESASLILERHGIDRGDLAVALKVRLERRLERMRQAGESIPPELLRLVKSL